MLASDVELLKRITHEPGKMGGRACIRGIRIRVIDILDMYASGMTEAEILHDFDYLEADDLRAALRYASLKLDHAIAGA